MNTREKDLKCEVSYLFVLDSQKIKNNFRFKNVIGVDAAKNQVFLKSVDDPKSPPKHFTFDGAYFTDSITETIYNDVGFSLVESVIY